MDLTGILKDYQSGLVALLGFTGVIITLIVNAALQRRQHQRMVDHERAVLRNALIAELKTVRDMYTRRIADTSLAETGHIIPTQTVTDIHRQVLSKLGLLTVDQVQKVIVAYQVIQALPENVRIKKRHAGISLEGDTESSIFVPPRVAAEMPDLYKEHGKYIEDAITALGGNSQGNGG